jgi:hypothetical protein
MFVSTVYIRNKNIVGAGFFWLMWSVCASFVFLSFISSSGALQLSVLILLVLVLGQLFLSIVKRREVKNELTDLDKILIGATSVTVFATIYFLLEGKVSGLDFVLEYLRIVSGGLLLGVVTSAMLLGHWYLVQPGLTRKPISKMCLASMVILGINVFFWLLPQGMISVLSGNESDGWGGTLGYMWVGSVFTTVTLLFMAYRALKEKSYSAVMATTGLLYLAILVANGVELLPRAIFS